MWPFKEKADTHQFYKRSLYTGVIIEGASFKFSSDPIERGLDKIYFFTMMEKRGWKIREIKHI